MIKEISFAKVSKAGCYPMYNPGGLTTGFTTDAPDSVWVKLVTVEWMFEIKLYSMVS